MSSTHHYTQPNIAQAPNYFPFGGTNLSQDGPFGAATLPADASSFASPPQPSRTAPPATPSTASPSTNDVPIVMPNLPARKNAAKSDDLEPYKAEIIARLRRGDTGRTIALDLVSRGVKTSEAALGHRRLQWGIRVRALTPPQRSAAMRSIWLPGGVQGGDYEARALGAVQSLGLDSATADLTGAAPLPRGAHSRQAPPAGWLYPHRRGKGAASNLDQFKDEIVERTRKGESLADIADVLVARGVQTSDRAVGRRRLQWGLRQRKSRTNLKNPPLDVAGRSVKKTPADYYRAHPAKVQIMRRLEITRMTKEGMSPQEIVDNLASRGVVWKKGVSSVLRLQTRWGLIPPEENPRHHANRISQALRIVSREQKAAFRQIGLEMNVENLDQWVDWKMRERGSREARRKLARERLGPLASSALDDRPRRATATVNKPRARRQGHESDDSDESASESESESSLSLSGSEPDEESTPPTKISGVADTAATNAGVGQDSSSEADSDSDGREDAAIMAVVDAAAPQAEEQECDADSDSAEIVAARIFARIGKAMPRATGAAPEPVPFYSTRSTTKPRPSAGEGLVRTRPRRRPSAALLAAPRRTRKATAASRRQSPAPAPHAENNDTAWYDDDGGLGGAPSRDSTPASASPAAPSQGPARPSQQQHPQQPSATAQPQASAPPHAQHAGISLPPPLPVLVVRPEEAEANKTTLDVVEQYTAAAQMVKDTVSARTENRALPGSLTGLPPSLKDVEAAKQRLKAAAHAMYTSL